MQRERVIAKINSQDTWDIIVIGGGATGLGIALEACTRGHSTLLVEQADFAKSTSGKSTKLVHGGVRYLAQGNLALVREATVERGLLSKNAPHLVRNQTFIIPVYSWWGRVKYTAGLKFYDWISGRQSLGPSVFISRKKVLYRLPGIKSQGLTGGIAYHDGQFDDARLAVNLAQTIFDNGGYAINYMKVDGLLKKTGKISGVMATDGETSIQYHLNAGAVINATGIFADTILKMNDALAPNTLSLSQGVHLVLDKKFLKGSDALMIPQTSDGRVLFIVPWHDKLLAGTTDTPVKESSLEPVAQDAEIDFILDTAAVYLTDRPTRKDVLSVFAGLRPLAAAKEAGSPTREISRSHKILVSATQLFTMIGGKWTTYRKMGEDMIDRVEKELGWKKTNSVTASLPVHGSVKNDSANSSLNYYGSDAEAVQRLEPLDREFPNNTINISEARIVWAIREEMARTLDDVLSRRTRSLLLDAAESMRVAPAVAAIMAREMQQDDRWIDLELKAYYDIAKNYLLHS
jgi:glycerol-3-phosphate dehydrogenase